MDVVEAEAQRLRAAGDGADHQQRARRRRWWPDVARLRPSIALVAACAAAVIVGGLILSLNSAVTPTRARTIRAQITRPARVAGAGASVRVRGSTAELVVTRLPTPAANHVDELWVQRGSAVPVPAGTFIVRSGSVVVARPVHRGDHVLVTEEPGRGTRAPTSAPFIVARV
jgi:hypothetical protein